MPELFMQNVTLKIRRYDPEKNESFIAEFRVPADEHTTVLDALNFVKDGQDGSLSYRWSCRMGICGSCGMTVNGKPVLTCQTYLHHVGGEEILVEPLRNFPIVKDLIVDIDDPMEKMRSVMPYTTLMERKSLEEGENLQSLRNRKKIDQTSQCIKCMLCYSACPVYGFDRKFAGPAAAALAYRYQKDSREKSATAKEKRMDQMTAKDGVWNCSFVGECSVVCPKRVDPAMALQRLKIMGSLHIAKSLFRKRKRQ